MKEKKTPGGVVGRETMSRARIFIVEDEAIVVEDLRNTLTRLGYEVAGWATGCREALAQAPGLRPDLVLMDISLSGSFDGIYAAIKLRREHSLPVVFLTAYADDETLGRAKAAEPFGYLVKPYSRETLKAAMEMALNLVRLERQLRHLNGILWTSRGIHRLIAKEKGAERLGEKVCRLLVDVRGYQAAWLFLFDGRQHPGRLIVARRHGDTLLVHQVSGGAALPSCYAQGLREESSLILRDSELCRTCPLAQERVECALVGVLSHEGRTYGILGVAVPAEFSGHPEEISLFEGLREDLGAAFHALALQEENRRAFAALQASEARYRSLVEHLGLGVALLSPEMRILSLNRPMQTWFPRVDVGAQPLCYESLREPPKREPCSYCPAIKTLADGEAHESRVEICWRGTSRRLRLLSIPVKDDAGRITGVIEMVEDLTAPEEADRVLRETRENQPL